MLAAVTLSVLIEALPALNLDLFTKTPATFGETGGGIAHGFVGRRSCSLPSRLRSRLPVGVLIAIYVSEFATTVSRASSRLALDILNGLPSIVVGIFLFVLFVVGHTQSA